MTERVTLKQPGDIPAVVEAFLGFKPEDSLVILGVGGGPMARVDITHDTIVEAVSAMATAAPHWTAGVVIAVYSDEVSPLDIGSAMLSILPDVPVRLTVQVLQTVAGQVVVSDDGSIVQAMTPDMPDTLAGKRVHSSREALVAEAAQTTSADEAWMVARESYRVGDGAKAWVFLDRFHALSERTEESAMLARFLTEAVSPRSEQAQALLSD